MDLKKHFPIFENQNIHYLDSASTTQKPGEVIDSIIKYYKYENANAGRGTHKLSLLNREIVENVRKKVAKFIGVSDEKNIVFTKGTTESLNMIAFSYALYNLHEGDEIILGISNHHSNIVPWQEIANIKKLRIKYIYLDEDGNLDLKSLTYKLSEKTKLVSISTIVNSTGIIQDFKEVIKRAHSFGAKVILDCAQSIIHFKHEFEEWDADFAAFSGHKMFSSQGIGILYAKKELLEIMKPFQFGGDMVEYVEELSSTFKEIPHKFEAGTLNIEGIKSLGRAIDYIEYITYENIENIEKDLKYKALYALSSLDFVEIYFLSGERAAIIPFNVKGVHSHDVAYILDEMGIAIRSGKHCSDPLMKEMKIYSCCRASFSIYNSVEDIKALVNALLKVKEIFLDK